MNYTFHKYDIDSSVVSIKVAMRRYVKSRGWSVKLPITTRLKENIPDLLLRPGYGALLKENNPFVEVVKQTDDGWVKCGYMISTTLEPNEFASFLRKGW